MIRTGLGLLALMLFLPACSEESPRRPGETPDDGGPVVARELAWRAPHGWERVPTASAFLRARYRLPSRVGGEPLELTIAHQAGGLGGVDANLARWLSQFRRAGGSPATSDDATIVRWPRAGDGVELMTISLVGTYVGGMETDVPERADQRLAGAVARLEDDSLWFLKCVGPRLQVESRLDEIEALWSSLRSVGPREEETAVAGATRLAYDVPAGWRPIEIAEGSTMRYASFDVPDPSGGAPIPVVLYHTPTGMGSAASNVARWAGQMKKADGTPCTPADASVVERRIGEFETTTVDLTGAYESMDGKASPAARLIGAISRGPDGRLWYLKAVGPAGRMVAVEEGIEALLASYRYEPIE